MIKNSLVAILFAGSCGLIFSASLANAYTYTLEKSNGKMYTYNTGKHLMSSGSIDNILHPEDLNDPVLHVYDLVITIDKLDIGFIQFRDKETNKYDVYTIRDVE